ncbi:MAG: glycosidase [Anaerolineales bacterium]|nr:glycosidase [Anaerolineales bacterium]
MKLKRYPANPLLLPDPTSDWETYNVFNPSVIYFNGLFHMHYRAQGLDWISRIEYAVSQDGVTWNRLRRPVLEPKEEFESRGVEDPRVTELDGVFYLAYTAYSGRGTQEHIITPMFARSTNLISWERIGPLVRGEDNKDHFLLPRKLEGVYIAFHRRPPSIWLAESPDLINWPESKMKQVMGPRPENWWDNNRVGGNAPPIETEFGWLTLYHAYDQDYIYRLGVCLLDLEDPTRVIHRPREPIFEPVELWELRGDVPNVVFSNANPVVDGTVYVYYGGADHVIGLATCQLDDLLDYARFG